MAFPKYHGITLAANSFIENLVIERLASDPAPVEAGRIWFNTTDKVFRQSTLDGTGAVVVKTFLTEEELTAQVADEIAAEAALREAADTTLQANITAEASARTAADTSLASAVDAEAAARTAADATLTANLAAEVSRATLAETTLQANIDAEAAARTAADATLTSNLAAEVTARQAADSSLSARIDALGNAFNYVTGLVGGTEGSPYLMAGLPADGKNAGDYYKVTTAGYFNDGTTTFYANIGDGLVWNTFGGVDKIDNTDSTVAEAVGGDVAVSGSADTGYTVDLKQGFKDRMTNAESAITAEVSARTSADTSLQNAIDAVAALAGGGVDAEASARIAADASLASAIDAEAATRAAADATLTANLASEVSRATLAETTLQANIDAEAAARSAADTTLQANIAAEATARAAADTSIKTAYNATVFTFDSSSGAAATTYTIDHGLNHAFVDVSVMVNRGSGVFFNDIVSVEYVTTSQIKVYLSEALHVKVICRSAATIA